MTSNTMAPTRPNPAALRCEPDEVIHVGVDIHKATYHVPLLSDRRDGPRAHMSRAIDRADSPDTETTRICE
jgi:hypothetical protein